MEGLKAAAMAEIQPNVNHIKVFCDFNRARSQWFQALFKLPITGSDETDVGGVYLVSVARVRTARMAK